MAGGLSTVVCFGQANGGTLKPDTLRQVVIKFQGRCPSELAELKQVYVVLDDDDAHEYRTIHEEQGDAWVWTLDSPKSYDRGTAHASVRYRNGRTDCREPSKWDPRKGIVTFTFWVCSDSSNPAVTLTVDKTNPKIDVSYLRRLDATGNSEPIGKSVACAEKAHFRTAGPRPVNAVWFGTEELALQLGREAANPKVRGLEVKLSEAEKKAGKKVYGLKNVTFDLFVQRAKGRDASGPNTSSNAIDIDTRELKNANFKKLVLKVE